MCVFVWQRTEVNSNMEQIQKRKIISTLLARKGVTQHLVLSISMFSLLFSYYYYYDNYYYPFLSNIVNLPFPIKSLFTHGIDKTCVFLICNGILVVLVKTSGSLISQSRFDLKEHVYIKTIHEALQTRYEDELVEVDQMEIRLDVDEDDMKVINDNDEDRTEELNKKFDEFIRKTKEELRSDAQLVMIPYN
ncbi:uncharacterized protein [Rutidosis leptorrhynchoides]|uniref:uncharacterized protein n=1 Tax=Rutidosis leptorrhynchoides TaxID=125765 RepID=UPI003A994739